MLLKLATRRTATYLVPHDSRTIEKDSRVIRPLDVVLPRAVDKTVSAVEDLVGLAVYQPYVRDPVVSPFGPLEVRVILCERSKTCGNVEEAAIRD